MYGRIWRALPGPPVLRAALAVLLAVGVAALLWFVVFPFVDSRYSLSPGTVG